MFHCPLVVVDDRIRCRVLTRKNYIKPLGTLPRVLTGSVDWESFIPVASSSDQSRWVRSSSVAIAHLMASLLHPSSLRPFGRHSSFVVPLVIVVPLVCHSSTGLPSTSSLPPPATGDDLDALLPLYLIGVSYPGNTLPLLPNPIRIHALCFCSVGDYAMIVIMTRF
ncbi:hypothetical protein ACLOJK_026015 [Asimina triloba]